MRMRSLNQTQSGLAAVLADPLLDGEYGKGALSRIAEQFRDLEEVGLGDLEISRRTGNCILVDSQKFVSAASVNGTHDAVSGPSRSPGE